MQNVTTRIQFASDFAVTAAMMKLTASDRIKAACRILNKDPENYAHLDNGRKGMTGANLLRGAARKNKDLVAYIEEVASDLAATYPDGFDPLAKPKKAATKKAVKKAAPMVWPKSKRFAFAHQEGADWKFSYTRKTSDDIARPEGV